MNRVRPKTSAQLHERIGAAAEVCTATPFPPSLRRYLLAYGVNHLAAGNELERAESLVGTWLASPQEPVNLAAIDALGLLMMSLRTVEMGSRILESMDDAIRMHLPARAPPPIRGAVEELANPEANEALKEGRSNPDFRFMMTIVPVEYILDFVSALVKAEWRLNGFCGAASLPPRLLTRPTMGVNRRLVGLYVDHQLIDTPILIEISTLKVIHSVMEKLATLVRERNQFAHAGQLDSSVDPSSLAWELRPIIFALTGFRFTHEALKHSKVSVLKQAEDRQWMDAPGVLEDVVVETKRGQRLSLRPFVLALRNGDGQCTYLAMHGCGNGRAHFRTYEGFTKRESYELRWEVDTESGDKLTGTQVVDGLFNALSVG